MSATLALIYNHRFERNVGRLDDYYGDAFDEVLHLMPFSSDPRPGVVPVFGSSHQFQGFIAQALPALMEKQTDYYVFCGDDLLLSPSVTSSSIEGLLGVDAQTSFIKDWHGLTDYSFLWWHFWRGFRPWVDEANGTQWQDELPARDDAVERLARLGYRDVPLTWRNFRRGHHHGLSRRAGSQALVRLVAAGGSIPLPYPLAAGYSDLVVVPRSVLPEFARICGVTAAMGVFVEVAVPTALGLATGSLSTQASISGGGTEFWTPDDVAAFEQRHDHDLAGLWSGSPSDVLWYHPVKLSRWK